MFSFPLFCSNSKPTSPPCYLINQTEKERFWCQWEAGLSAQEIQELVSSVETDTALLAAGLIPQSFLTSSLLVFSWQAAATWAGSPKGWGRLRW